MSGDGSASGMVDMQVLEQQLAMVETEAGTLELAARLDAQGDLTGAASVLERYLIANRNAVLARAEYAIALCRLDDVRAGLVETAKLASIPAGPDVMQRVAKVCGPAQALAEQAG